MNFFYEKKTIYAIKQRKIDAIAANRHRKVTKCTEYETKDKTLQKYLGKK